MMMKTRWIPVITMTAMAFETAVLFGQAKVGTTAMTFLGIPAGPRACAMAGAFSAMGDDAASLYYNPGAISRSIPSQFSAARMNWLAGSRFNWIGFVLHLDSENALGFALTQLDYGGEEDVNTVVAPEGTGEKWDAADLAVGISYARNLTDRFSIGGTAKYVQQRIWHETASAFAFDVGLLFITPFRDMRLGMSISNFGSDAKMDGQDLLHSIDLDPEFIGNNKDIMANLKTESWPLPLFFRVGLAMDAIKRREARLTIAVDALRPSDNTETMNVGAEFALYERVFLRGGWQSLFRNDSDAGLTLGCGFRMPLGSSTNLNVDYAFEDYKHFDNVQMISLGVGF
jgi:hypothetical protein